MYFTFPDKRNIADIILVYKKQDVSDIKTDSPIGLLPIISKIFEKVLYSQLETVANKIFSPKSCRFRKRSFLAECFFELIKELPKCLVKSGVVETVLIDL